jgi:hypothetical protein
MWSIAASGPKDNVVNKIVTAQPPPGAERPIFLAAQALCRAAVAAVSSDTCTVLAGGDERGCHVTVASGAAPEAESEAEVEEPSEEEDEEDDEANG